MCIDYLGSLVNEEGDNLVQLGKLLLFDKRNLENDIGDFVFFVVLFGSLFCIMVIDIVLGVFIVLWFFLNSYNICVIDFMMEKIGIVVELFNELLDWLKGVFVGFKLNKYLVEYLSIFFFYYVYFW